MMPLALRLSIHSSSSFLTNTKSPLSSFGLFILGPLLCVKIDAKEKKAKKSHKKNDWKFLHSNL